MALARSFTESGSDEVRDGIVDICSYCATDEKLQPATHFCFDCGVYGRYICGICLRNHNKFVNNHDVERIGSQSDSRRKQLQTDLAVERRKSESMANKLTEALQELDIHKEKSKQMKKQLADEQKNVEKLKVELDELHKELDVKESEITELTKRFTKVAGQKLEEKNADIADLSDPNRAMKLSERFSQIYDNDWTDAFQALWDRKMKSKEAIQCLMNILKGCYDNCEVVAAHQLEELKTLLIQPVKTVVEAPKGHAGIKGKPRLSSKHERILKDARRQMWDVSVDIVKQMILEKMKEWLKKEVGKKAFDDTKEYIEKCTETCWLMVIHEPPIYMKMDTKQGEKLDANLYTPYSVSGEKIDFLVWPPLFNGKDGGLLSKGVAEPLKLIRRDQK